MEKYENTNKEIEQSNEWRSENESSWDLVADMADKMEENSAYERSSVENNTEVGLEKEVREDYKLDEVQESVELEQVPESRKLRLMRETWGDFDSAQEAGIFGPNTRMDQYEYRSLAQNLPWEEFASLADQAYNLGYKSYDDYREMVYQVGDKLRDENVVSTWREFGLAVKRYNVAKHFSELDKNVKWHTELSIRATNLSLPFQHKVGKIGGGMMPIDLDQDDGLEKVGKQDKTGKVDWFWNRDLMDDDDFDVFGGKVVMQNAPNDNVYGVVVDDVATLKWIEQYKAKHEIYNKVPIFTKQEWKEGYSNSENYRRETDRLINEAILNVDKQKVNDFVNPFLEKVNPDRLLELSKAIKSDYKNGAEEAVKYFAEVLGFRTPDLQIVARKDAKKVLGADVLGNQSGIVESNMRLRIREQELKRRPDEAIDTIAHELLHMKQRLLTYEWANGELSNPEDIERAELYNTCDEYYKNSKKSYAIYRHQLVEEEAHVFGRGVKKKLKRAKSPFRFFNRRK